MSSFKFLVESLSGCERVGKKTWLNHNITFYTCRDYRPIVALDIYDAAALDDEEFDEMDREARREAERLMRKRDREEAATRGRLHRGLLYGIRIFFCSSKSVLFLGNNYYSVM